MKTLQSLRNESGSLSICSDTSPDVDHENTAAPGSLGLENHDYAYSNLPDKHIRLLRLEAILANTGENSPTLRCKISGFPLTATPKFVAVSYCWGDESNPWYLICSGRRLRVHRNIYDLLLELSQVRCNDWLWIDAICINQGNRDEKNHQIPMMKDIYSQADLVLAWFGPAQDDLIAAWPFIQMLPDVLRSSSRYVNGVVVLQWPEDQQPPSGFLEILRRFICVPFLSRLWVVQEIALAKTVLVLAGSFLVTWNDPYDVAMGLVSQMYLSTRHWASEPILVRMLGAISSILNIGSTRIELQRNDAPSGRDLIPLSRFHIVSKPQDKVYALLGLLGTSTREKLVVDVGKPVEEVYLDWSAYLFNTSRSPWDLLHQAGTSSIAIAGLPSWCFDLSVNCRSGYRHGAFASSEYPAIVRTMIDTEYSVCKPKFEASVQEKTLQVSGWEVDHVKEVIEVPSSVRAANRYDVLTLGLGSREGPVSVGRFMPSNFEGGL
ncbi:hypothetical protein IFR04_013061 [Cadophora malorum]|uniref:Heterokaryon incompatibility domain-containing protein n=1 Tax=Cadophora malorum TaxID=108018 RepID=A0A8H7W7J8_9HELO|nr:hypothetical protein IFR04_013061 [Cadophora malorum]